MMTTLGGERDNSRANPSATARDEKSSRPDVLLLLFHCFSASSDTEGRIDSLAVKPRARALWVRSNVTRRQAIVLRTTLPILGACTVCAVAPPGDVKEEPCG